METGTLYHILRELKRLCREKFKRSIANLRYSFKQLILLVLQPLVRLLSGHALDGLLGIHGLLAADAVDKELAALGLVEGLCVAGRIAELAGGTLLDQLGSLGIILNFADNLLHGVDFPFDIGERSAPETCLFFE